MSKTRVLMVAAENDYLPGAKVGGVADVIRDLPKALVKKGLEVQSIIPSYGFLAKLPNLHLLGEISVRFAGKWEDVQVFCRPAEAGQADAFIVHSPLFSPQGDTVYCHDGSNSPFATDATKFAFFSASVARALLKGLIPSPDILHCHDWHSAFLLILLRSVPELAELASIKTVYSIHNLAMQGVRPFRNDPSAFETWFPEVVVDPRDIADTRVPHCINPMRAGIILSDYVHTVSPSYAQEILSPSDVERGIYGGEGLEADLQKRADQGNLFGILNGCEYPNAAPKKPKKGAAKKKPLSQTALIKLIETAVLTSAAASSELKTAHWIAEKRVKQWAARRKAGMLLTSVGRVTEQKARLFSTEVAPGVTALSAILEKLGSHGTFVMIGSGDKDMEQALVKESAAHENFIFLNGFVPAAANALYECGDLFLMPSSFEPCGISQLLSMRAGQPCLVNRVGGLRDTVEPNRTGFAFEGDDAVQQAKAMVETFDEALRVFTTSEEIWQSICHAAAKVRFTWDSVADDYVEKLYQL